MPEIDTPKSRRSRKPRERVYGKGYKLIGKNYPTNDLLPRSPASRNMLRTFAPKACCFAGWCSAPCRTPASAHRYG